MTDTQTVAEPVNLTAAPQMTFPKEVKFSFKKADPATGTKRPPVELKLPVPTLDGVVAFLQDPVNGAKNREFLLDLLADVVKEQARQQVADDDKPVNKQDELDIAKLDLTYIANLPPAERRGGGIDKEIWEAFGVLYNEVMPGKTGKSAEAVANAATLFLKKFLPIKTNKKIITLLKEQLDLFYSSIAEDKQEEFAGIYEYLSNKADVYLASNEVELLTANL